MKLKILALMSLAVAISLAACGEDKKPDAAQFQGMCEELAKCDEQLKNLGMDPVAMCKQMFVGVAEKYPDRLPELKSCIDAQSCEEKNATECFTKFAQGMGMPGQ